MEKAVVRIANCPTRMVDFATPDVYTVSFKNSYFLSLPFKQVIYKISNYKKHGCTVSTYKSKWADPGNNYWAVII